MTGVVAVAGSLAVALAAGAFLWWRLVRAPRLTGRVRWVALAGIALVAAGCAVAGITARQDHPSATRWLTAVSGFLVALAVYTALGLVVLAIVDLVWRLRRPHERGRLTWLRRASAAVVALALLVTTGGTVAATLPQTTHVTVTSGDLPSEFDGLKVAVLSDLHVGLLRGRAYAADIVRRVNALQPDLVVLAGDIADGEVDTMAADVEPLADLSAPSGVVVTTGNHEFSYGVAAWLDHYRSLGLTVLDNDGIVLVRGSSAIDVLGVNDRTGTVPYQEDLPRALREMTRKYGVPADGAGRFRLLVAHQPRQVFSRDGLAGRSGIDLVVSGHTHGGQMWPAQAVIAAQQPVVAGLATVGGVQVFVSRGVGTTGPPVRVGAPPEIALLTLKRG